MKKEQWEVNENVGILFKCSGKNLYRSSLKSDIHVNGTIRMLTIIILPPHQWCIGNGVIIYINVNVNVLEM